MKGVGTKHSTQTDGGQKMGSFHLHPDITEGIGKRKNSGTLKYGKGTVGEYPYQPKGKNGCSGLAAFSGKGGVGLRRVGGTDPLVWGGKDYLGDGRRMVKVLQQNTLGGGEN